MWIICSWVEGGKEEAGQKRPLVEAGQYTSKQGMLLSVIHSPEVLVCSMKRLWAPMWPQKMELVKLSR